MGLPAPRAAALHRTRQADAERLYRKLQRQVPRRVSQRQLLLRSRRCAAKDRDLEDAVQPRTPTSEPGLSNPGGVRDAMGKQSERGHDAHRLASRAGRRAAERLVLGRGVDKPLDPSLGSGWRLGPKSYIRRMN